MKILLVDDSEDNVLLIKLFLKSFQDEILFALNGQEGLEQFISFRPDYVLMDLEMPIMGGIESLHLMREFAENTKDWNPQIIAMTGNADNEMASALLKEGFDKVLSKPFNKRTLFEILGR